MIVNSLSATFSFEICLGSKDKKKLKKTLERVLTFGKIIYIHLRRHKRNSIFGASNKYVTAIHEETFCGK